MPVKVKKNKTPKRAKRSTMQQKQSVNQNVKVTINKPSRIPKEFKVAQANKGVPNIRELPTSFFHQPTFQPRLTLYQEKFGDAKPVHVSPFERQLASLAVQDNRAVEVSKLKNSLESDRLKRIEREPIQAPSFRGETEEEKWTARATASMEDNRPPFSVSSRDEATTLRPSFKSRLTEGDKVEMAQMRLKNIPRTDYLKTEPNNITRSLHQAEEEGLEGQANTGWGESQTFRTDAIGGTSEAQLEHASVQHTTQAGEDHEHTMPLGVPSIPNRLTEYYAQEGTPGDLLEAQRGEVVPFTQGQIEAEERRRPGRPIEYSDTQHREAREEKANERRAEKHYKKGLAQKIFNALKK
jgi:hypothetical protein